MQIIIALLQPNEWMMIAAMVGAAFYMINGYLANKQENPDMKFDYTYLTKTLVTVMGAGLAFEAVEVNEIGLGAIIIALMAGLGGNSVLSKMATRKEPCKSE